MQLLLEHPLAFGTPRVHGMEGGSVALPLLCRVRVCGSSEVVQPSDSCVAISSRVLKSPAAEKALDYQSGSLGLIQRELSLSEEIFAMETVSMAHG